MTEQIRGEPGQVWAQGCSGIRVVVDHWDDDSVVWHAQSSPEFMGRYTPEAFRGAYAKTEWENEVMADWESKVGPGFDK